MTVKELIKNLKKYPQDHQVVWKDHDHGEGEFNDKCRTIDTDFLVLNPHEPERTSECVVLKG